MERKDFLHGQLSIFHTTWPKLILWRESRPPDSWSCENDKCYNKSKRSWYLNLLLRNCYNVKVCIIDIKMACIIKLVYSNAVVFSIEPSATFSNQKHYCFIKYYFKSFIITIKYPNIQCKCYEQVLKTKQNKKKNIFWRQCNRYCLPSWVFMVTIWINNMAKIKFSLLWLLCLMACQPSWVI